MTPLDLNHEPQKIIADTWTLMEAKMRSVGNSTATINNAKQYYIAGVCAAAAAVLTERSTYNDLSKAAIFVENQR